MSQFALSSLLGLPPPHFADDKAGLMEEKSFM